MPIEFLKDVCVAEEWQVLDAAHSCLCNLLKLLLCALPFGIRRPVPEPLSQGAAGMYTHQCTEHAATAGMGTGTRYGGWDGLTVG